MTGTAGMIAGLQDTHRQLGSILRRTDPDRRRELICVRRTMIQQLWQLKSHASGPECSIDSALKQELAKRVSAIWGEVALIQATWPAATLDQHAGEHYAATRKTKATFDDFFQWAEKHIIPSLNRTPGKLRNVSSAVPGSAPPPPPRSGRRAAGSPENLRRLSRSRRLSSP